MREFVFDLQQFAEEVQEPNVQDTGTQEDVSTEVNTEIPAELEGVSPEVAKSIMDEAGIGKEDTAEPEDNNAAEGDAGNTDGQNADADHHSDTKDVDDVLDNPQTSVPYTRFKEVNDKFKSVKAELEELKKNANKADAVSSRSTTPEVQQQVQKPVIQSFNITPEIAQKIETAAQLEAMKMTGMTKDDIEALTYADDDDPKRTSWQTALSLARSTISNSIVTAAQEQQRRELAFLQEHQKLVDNFNAFSNQEMQEEDFGKVQEFAVGEYFKGKSPMEQQILTEAYDRVQRNVASPAEYLSVMNYFKEAKGAYFAKNPKAAPAVNKKDSIKQKIAQAEKQPRSSQIDGATSTDGKSVTVESLQQMLETTSWEKIPDEYKAMLLGGSISQ